MIPYLILLAYLFNNFLGIDKKTYKSYGNALASNFMLMIGINNEEFSPKNFTTTLLLLISIFTNFLLFSGLISSIFVEALRYTILEFGHEFYGKESEWQAGGRK